MKCDFQYRNLTGNQILWYFKDESVVLEDVKDFSDIGHLDNCYKKINIYPPSSYLCIFSKLIVFKVPFQNYVFFL